MQRCLWSRMITYPLDNAIPHVNTEISTIPMTLVQESQAEFLLPSFITILDLGMGQNYFPKNGWLNCNTLLKIKEYKRYSALRFAGPLVSMFHPCAFYFKCVVLWSWIPVSMKANYQFANEKPRVCSDVYDRSKWSVLHFFLWNSFWFHENCRGARRLAPCKCWMLGFNCRSSVSKVYFYIIVIQ